MSVCRTSPDVPAYQGCSMIVVPTANAGNGFPQRVPIDVAPAVPKLRANIIATPLVSCGSRDKRVGGESTARNGDKDC